MKVLDSDFLIALLRKDPSARPKLVELDASGEMIAITIFNAHEVMIGALQSKNPENADATRRLIYSFRVLNYDLEAMHHATEITRGLTEKGQRIGAFDELIAGVCIANNATVVTRNLKDFKRVPGLKVESW